MDFYNAEPDESFGNISADYGSTTVDQVSFRWRNWDNAQGFQYIGLYDINYVVPEASTITSIVMLLVLMLIAPHLSRKRMQTLISSFARRVEQ
ncbi:MAG: hypothetical protein AAF558_01475 [Verrucomicrobiota bacterium]